MDQEIENDSMGLQECGQAKRKAGTPKVGRGLKVDRVVDQHQSCGGRFADHGVADELFFTNLRAALRHREKMVFGIG